MSPYVFIVAQKHSESAIGLTHSSRLSFSYFPQTCIVYGERVLLPLAHPLMGNVQECSRCQNYQASPLA